MPRTSSPAFVSALVAATVLLTPAESSRAESNAYGNAALAEHLPPFVGTTASQDDMLESLASSPAWQFKPVGRSSIVLRMRTRSRVTGGFKVKSDEADRGYANEVVAYRIARLLLLDNVPPATFRTSSRQEIRSAFHKKKRNRWPAVDRQVAWEDDETVVGAASVWTKMARRGLERRKAVWSDWTRLDGTVPPDKSELAADLSNMVLFDFLIGNVDRYSSGNLLMDPGGARAILVDNDAGFSELDFGSYEALLADLTRTERFSKTTVSRLLALDRDALLGELPADYPHDAEPLLDATQIGAILARRDTLLSYVAALVQEHGRDQVLVFP